MHVCAFSAICGESAPGQEITCPARILVPGKDTLCALFLGGLCVCLSVCVCAQEALNSSWIRAGACKGAREAGNPGPATAETA